MSKKKPKERKNTEPAWQLSQAAAYALLVAFICCFVYWGLDLLDAPPGQPLESTLERQPGALLAWIVSLFLHFALRVMDSAMNALDISNLVSFVTSDPLLALLIGFTVVLFFVVIVSDDEQYDLFFKGLLLGTAGRIVALSAARKNTQ